MRQNFSTMSMPSLGGNRDRHKPSPTTAPTGGFFSGLRDVTIQVPTRAFNNNLYVASNRATGTIPENAMTPDVHSYFWTFGGPSPVGGRA